MRTADWKGIAELIGIVAIVGSLIFVGLEVRQQQLMAQNEAGFNVVEDYRQFGNSVIENADIWVRGNAGEELDGIEGVIFEQLIRNYWAGAFWTAQTLEVVGEHSSVPIHDFAGFLHRNPGGRRVWEATMAVEQEYRERLVREPAGVKFMEIVLADLEKLEN
jgi:hypothetical protein